MILPYLINYLPIRVIFFIIELINDVCFAILLRFAAILVLMAVLSPILAANWDLRVANMVLAAATAAVEAGGFNNWAAANRSSAAFMFDYMYVISLLILVSYALFFCKSACSLASSAYYFCFYAITFVFSFSIFCLCTWFSFNLA